MNAGEGSQVNLTGKPLPGRKYRCIVHFKILGKPIETLIDTGATSSAISKDCLFKFSKHERFINRKDSRICVSVNNQTLKSLYTVILPIELKSDDLISHEFEVIPNLISQALLGTDFLKQHDAVLDFSANELQIYNEKYTFDTIHTIPGKILSASEDCWLEPESITLVKARFPGHTNRRDIKSGTFFAEQKQLSNYVYHKNQ